MTDDKDKDDKIKLVSERSEHEIAAQSVTAELGWAVNQLAANILRVIAGAGENHSLARQMSAVLKHYEELSALFRSGKCPYSPEAPMHEVLQDWRVKSHDRDLDHCED